MRFLLQENTQHALTITCMDKVSECRTTWLRKKANKSTHHVYIRLKKNTSNLWTGLRPGQSHSMSSRTHWMPPSPMTDMRVRLRTTGDTPSRPLRHEQEWHHSLKALINAHIAKHWWHLRHQLEEGPHHDKFTSLPTSNNQPQFLTKMMKTLWHQADKNRNKAWPVYDLRKIIFLRVWKWPGSVSWISQV